MSVLYVTEQGAVVGIKGKRLVVHKGRTVIKSVRLDDCVQVVLMGHAQITTQAIRSCLEHGVELLFLTRGGRFLGRLSGSLSGNVELRQSQYKMLMDPDACLTLARLYVQGKISNARTLLMRYQAHHRNEHLASALVRFRSAPRRLKEADTLDEIRGVEGIMAKEYFGAFGKLIQAEGFHFTKRLRRPPPDPVNVLLSYGYTLLAGVVHGFVEQAGLDPYLGALHAPRNRRPSMVLDLMEEFRPVIVDSAVLKALNGKAIMRSDFVFLNENEISDIEDEWEREEYEDNPDIAPEPASRKVILTPLGSKKWVNIFERRLNESIEYPRLGCRFTYRQIIREQVYLLCRHLQGKDMYEPFKYRW